MLDFTNLNKDVPVHSLIKDYMQAAIALGELKPGDRMPTYRELGKELGYSRTTVEYAYHALEMMGYIECRGTHGTFVKEGCLEKCRQDFLEGVFARLFVVIAEAKVAGFKASDIEAVARKCLDSTAGPREETPREVMALAKDM